MDTDKKPSKANIKGINSHTMYPLKMKIPWEIPHVTEVWLK